MIKDQDIQNGKLAHMQLFNVDEHVEILYSYCLLATYVSILVNYIVKLVIFTDSIVLQESHYMSVHLSLGKYAVF